MGEPKLTGFLVGLVVLSFFVGVFGLFFAEINSKYNVEYNPANLEVYNKLDNLNERANTYKQDIQEIGAARNLVEKSINLVDAFFSSGYTTLMTVYDSVDVSLSMADSAATQMAENGVVSTGMTGLLKTMLTTLLIVLLFIGIGLSILIKRYWGSI